METNTIIWIALLVVYIVFLVLDLKIFFYKRTMHKIHLKTSIATADIYSIVAPNMVWGDFFVRTLKWGVLIALFFYNWVVALISLAAAFILPMVLPEQDDFKNMFKMASAIEKKNDNSSKAMYNVIKEILMSEFGMTFENDDTLKEPITRIRYRK